MVRLMCPCDLLDCEASCLNAHVAAILARLRPQALGQRDGRPSAPALPGRSAACIRDTTRKEETTVLSELDRAAEGGADPIEDCEGDPQTGYSSPGSIFAE